MNNRSYKSRGIVLKRKNAGEADRIVTIFTREFGKITVIAKGVRKITSSRSGMVETGTEADFYCVKSKGMDILTQAKLVASFQRAYQDLVTTTIVFQMLEIIDNLTVEGLENNEIYDLLHISLERLEAKTASKPFLLEQIRLIIKALGFTYDKQFTETKLKEYIEELSQKRLKSKRYLSLATRQ